ENTTIQLALHFAFPLVSLRFDILLFFYSYLLFISAQKTVGGKSTLIVNQLSVSQLSLFGSAFLFTKTNYTLSLSLNISECFCVRCVSAA
ncbi:hypothetical protein M5D96_014040, partial [Drosophila gunungcola]